VFQSWEANENLPSDLLAGKDIFFLLRSINILGTPPYTVIMFCADYVMAFVYHTLFTSGTVYLFGSNVSKKKNGAKDEIGDSKDSSVLARTNNQGIQGFLLQLAVSGLGLNAGIPMKLGLKPKTESYSQDQDLNYHKTEADGQSRQFRFINVAHPLCFGIASGVATSLTLYPFDFVRGGVLPPGMKRILSAGSTVPYAGMLFGLYFSMRDPTDISSQTRWAACSASAAVLAEIPFDHAKRQMMGSTRVMVGAGLLYVPFATIMLVLYDKAVTKYVTKVLENSS